MANFSVASKRSFLSIRSKKSLQPMRKMNTSLERIHTFGMSTIHKVRGDEPASRNVRSPNEGGKRIVKTESLRKFPSKVDGNQPKPGDGDAAISDKKEDMSSSDEYDEVKIEVVISPINGSGDEKGHLSEKKVDKD